MSSVRGNLCRRIYDELSQQFSEEVSELVKRYGYNMENVNCCMKRLLKIAESRDPTPNDLTMSAALKNMSKDHLEQLFRIFRNLVKFDTQKNHNGSFARASEFHSGNNVRRQAEYVSTEDSSEEIEELSDSSDSQPIGENQYEVERIISRIKNADGSYVYHVKWVGYESSSEPENFVDEKDMLCPDLIKEFEDLERLRIKLRAKKLKKQALLARKRKLEAEQRRRTLNTFSASKFSDEDESEGSINRNVCEVIDMCSSDSSSSEENFPTHSSKLPKSYSNCTHEKSERKEIVEKSPVRKDDHYDGFKYVRRESDGFQKGYKVVKVSVVTEHPINGRVVGVVVFAHPDGEEFAQYIPLREIHQNAPLAPALMEALLEQRMRK
ncbi:chromo' (CHRromatin Organization MOdifier) domain protein [Necator americanus]|uniref:Chromo' (CHRromatin Organization MOdifier) domain protein n=1 Tax=Necator americanus TaxID=51031 RepID=W2T6J7_NECAM|nr:chromo' (CHRromatin Organization MOdifier) domain protein [Necator americanus]ETN76761.1 chromo' (CHRromatin Organization MOdifier) domain protein [Necator americanus]